MKAVWPVIASNGVCYLQMVSVELHITSEKGKERKDRYVIDMTLWKSEIYLI